MVYWLAEMRWCSAHPVGEHQINDHRLIIGSASDTITDDQNKMFWAYYCQKKNFPGKRVVKKRHSRYAIRSLKYIDELHTKIVIDVICEHGFLRGETLLKNQLELVTATTVAGTLYGIIFTLFCLYVHSLTRQLRVGDRKGQAKFMIGYSTVIMLCGLYYLVTNAWVMQDAYIKHSNYPGGPLSYIGSMFTNNPLTSIGLTCQVIVDALTSAIQIWRVWVIWSATRYAHLVIVPPILCFLTFTALELRTVILKIILPSAESFQRDAKTTIAETALQGATTILCTMLISVYLIVKQWQQRKLIGTSQGATGYMSVVAMLVESYALESTWLLAVGIVWNHSIVPFFQKSVTYIAIIAYFLVQYRVAGGKAYESQRGQKIVSSLHWNHSVHATTMFGGAVDVHGGPHVRTVPEASNVPEVSRMV